MFVTTKGYLISKTDYGDFDEIISFINEYGIKFTCFSNGSRKIMSKNARNLNYGNYCEFEFFNGTNKLSKLKKVSTITYLNNEYQLSYALHIINDYFNQIDIDNKQYYQLYQKVIYYLINDVNDYLIILFICINIYKLSGIKIKFNRCCKCNSNLHIKTISLDGFGAICNLCINNNYKLYGTETLKIMMSIQDDESFDLITLKEFDIKKIRTLILDLMFFIHDKLGLYSNFLKVI